MEPPSSHHHPSSPFSGSHFFTHTSSIKLRNEPWVSRGDRHSSAELCLPQSRRVPHPHFILRWMTGRIHSISRELPADLIPLPDCQYQACPPESEPSTVPDRLQSRGQCKIRSPLFRMWGGNLVLVPVMSPLRLGHSTPCIQFKDKEPYFW